MKFVIDALFRVYKLFFSPILILLFGGGCRFNPTCSEYAHEALIKHGLLKGGTLSLKRITRCHPGSTFSYDPVK